MSERQIGGQSIISGGKDGPLLFIGRHRWKSGFCSPFQLPSTVRSGLVSPMAAGSSLRPCK